MIFGPFEKMTFYGEHPLVDNNVDNNETRGWGKYNSQMYEKQRERSKKNDDNKTQGVG